MKLETTLLSISCIAATHTGVIRSFDKLWKSSISFPYTNISLIVVVKLPLNVTFSPSIFIISNLCCSSFSLGSLVYISNVSPIVKLVQDDTVLINSTGEGGIWVCSKGGNIECGDYITTCIVPGYGVKQTDDVLHNYTVAKITCDIDFSNVSGFENKNITHNSITYIACFVGCTYHCG